ncbi:MAG: helix-turn-helix transcriptional regulator [Clostridia bacterium]|nr:helix-turn-helix transcriptional regulator [Clostridia bacterium]
MYTLKIEREGWSYQHTLTPTPDPDNFFMHAHDTCEILYFVSGGGNYLVESTAYALQAGCVLLMRPGEVHRLQVDPSQPYERIVLQFHENWLLHFNDLYRPLLTPFTGRPLGQNNLYTPSEFDSRFVLSCMKRIEGVEDEAMQTLIAETVLPTVLAEFYKAYSARRDPDAAHTVSPHTRIQDILLYVNEHLFDELSLDELCSKFYISKTQLGRLFRAATGSTAWDYILVKRLVEARRQILSGVPVTEASLRCGFRDYSAFYRAYKKRYGESPVLDRRRTMTK